MNAMATASVMASPASTERSWGETNQGYLVADFTRLRKEIEGGSEIPDKEKSFEMQPAPAIDQLTEIFNLTAFERDLLLLCAGVEMDSALAVQCAESHGNPQRSYVTFGLAMAMLAEPHWS